MTSDLATGVRLKAAVPQFTVKDLEATTEYYRDVLGFQIAGYYGSPPVFGIVQRDEVQVFFNRGDGSEFRTGKARGAYDAYFHLAGVDSLAVEFRARGADILEGPIVRDYAQRELVVRDPNGLVLAFGEDTSGGKHDR
jgi:catechol 2,3-dioxygenase-like lactoylglutathione lyase family enzyme